MLRKCIRTLRSEMYRAYSNIFGSDSYNRFVVLGRGRVGSNFLNGILNQHKQVVSHGEVFRVYNEETSHIEPINYLSTDVYKKYPGNIKAVGFKLFYYHARNAQWDSLWRYLQSERDIKIIHIKRENILKTYLSLKVAERTNQWIDRGSNNKPPPHIELDFDGCLKMFEQTREYESQNDEFFRAHDVLKLSYENLVSSYYEETMKVQNFLGLDIREDIRADTYKQEKRSLSESISNYYELKNKFSGSPWGEFFEN